jgi:hypothetical protein
MQILNFTCTGNYNLQKKWLLGRCGLVTTEREREKLQLQLPSCQVDVDLLLSHKKKSKTNVKGMYPIAEL